MRNMWLIGIGLALLAALTAAGAETIATTSAASAPATTEAALVPKQGALLGVYYGAGSLEATDKRIGRKPQIHLVFYSWKDDWTAGAKRDLADGRIPLVNWEPDGVDFKKIVDGTLDATIKARAAGAKELGKPFFLDFAAEMNGDEAWGGHNPTLYVAAYRHIHDLFVAAGATNVVWAWCPDLADSDGGNAKTMEYYPGDAYVDWTGVDGYNWTKYNGKWLSFERLFAKVYPLLAAKKKPILIGEMASAEVGGNKAEWIDGVIPTLKEKYPLIKGVVWFDINKETDWRISSSAGAQEAFARMAKDAYFNP